MPDRILYRNTCWDCRRKKSAITPTGISPACWYDYKSTNSLLLSGISGNPLGLRVGITPEMYEEIYVEDLLGLLHELHIRDLSIRNS